MDTETVLQSGVLLISAGGIALTARGGWRLNIIPLSFYVFLGGLALAGLCDVI